MGGAPPVPPSFVLGGTGGAGAHMGGLSRNKEVRTSQSRGVPSEGRTEGRPEEGGTLDFRGL